MIISGDKSIRLYDKLSGKLLNTFSGHSESIYSMSIHPFLKEDVKNENEQFIKGN